MNLTFDLQSFTGTSLTIISGISGGAKEYTISNVVLSGELASTSNSKYANFNVDSSVANGFKGEYKASMSGDSVLAFGTGATDKDSPKTAGFFGNGAYTWNFSSDQITSVSLGKNTKLNLIKAGSAGLTTSLNAAAGQEIGFTGNIVKLNIDTVGSGQKAIEANIALKGGASEVSLLTGSSLEGATISGGSNRVISLASKNQALNLFNLKGSSSEAVVTVGGAASSTVHSASVEGFSKITFGAGGTGGNLVSLSGVKDSGVSIAGGTGKDTIVIGENLKRSTVSITGGAAQDDITLSGTGAELLNMGDATMTSGGDSVTNWMSTTGDTTKGNTLKIEGLMSTFYAKDVIGTEAIVGQGADSTSTADKTGTTLMSSNTTADKGFAFGVNVKASDDTYSALLVGKNKLTSVQGIKFSTYNGYIIADNNQILNLGDTDKKTVVLANTTDTKHWDDTAVYQNVVSVVSSSAGKSLIINGVDNASMGATLQGSSDSIWSANNYAGDNISLKSGKDQVVYTGASDGLDSIQNYEFGTSLSKANAVRFLDGVNYIAASDKTLTIGADANNAAVISVTAGKSTGDSIAYGFGTGSDKYIAAVDLSMNGDGKIAYGSGVSVYIGQGDNSYISVGSSASNVKLGWDGGAGVVSIGGVDAKLAADGAVIVGLTGYAQSIAGSSRGASSISGGFVADEWTDTKADTLVGGGVSTKTTTFFVGDDMGKDEIQNLSSKDNIVFLGSKFEDLVKFAPTSTDKSFEFTFANGNIIEASVVGNRLSAVKDVSLYFDDGTYIWNGSTLEKAAE
ncbi:MAG: hypothetical protein J6I62_01845 [Selenomonadaceae bacterium]|nr:hypothetical protein [Selenomonadaceae bacterium]